MLLLGVEKQPEKQFDVLRCNKTLSRALLRGGDFRAGVRPGEKIRPLALDNDSFLIIEMREQATSEALAPLSTQERKRPPRTAVFAVCLKHTLKK